MAGAKINGSYHQTQDDGKFLLPCSNVRDKALAESLVKHNITYSEAIIYKTVAIDLSDLSDVKYDMLVFFNSMAIDSLYTDFPNSVRMKHASLYLEILRQKQ